MRAPVVLLMLLSSAIALSGCVADADETPEPRTIRLRVWIEDLLGHEVYPGLEVNLWAFCAAPADPTDEASAAAVEHRNGRECSVPGPTLRLREGDRVVVDFTNQHLHHHTIHWHGQHTPWQADGVPGSTQDPVPKGGVFTYDFVAKRTGTLWYHCHVDTAFHVMQGLYGVVIVEPHDRRDEPDVDREQVLVLGGLVRDLVEATPERKKDPHIDHKDLGGCGETGQPGCQNPAQDLSPDVFLLNGVAAPNTLVQDDSWISLEPGERVRLRIVNAGSTFEALHPHGHDLTVTHVDGVPLGRSDWHTVDTLPVAPGQRIDAVLEGSEEMQGVWVFHTHVTSHVRNDGQYPGGMLTKIVYEGYEDQAVGAFASEAMGGRPYTPPFEVPDDARRTVRLELGTGPADASRDLEVPAACALSRLQLGVSVDAPTSAMQDLNDLRLDVTDADGRELGSVAVGGARYAEWAVEGDKAQHLPQTVAFRITGTSADAVATLDAWLRYDDAGAAQAACRGDDHDDGGGNGGDHGH